MRLSSQGCNRLFITSCGRVVCDSCRSKLSLVDCSSCRGPCTKTIPLNRDTPPNVINLFKDASDRLKEVLKQLAFQENQKKNILEHKEKMCRKLEQETDEQQTEMDRLDELLAQGRQQLDHLEKEATSMKIHCAGTGGVLVARRTVQSSSLKELQMSPAFYAGMAELSPARRRADHVQLQGGGGQGRGEEGAGRGCLGLAEDSDVFKQRPGVEGQRVRSITFPMELGDGGREEQGKPFKS